ncbi:hypothetical protein ONZ45_g8402 [Pleurotus djamor]|nr:hypothetical protein ONZ45_g8402 [Pleurotus djamor]
MTPSNDDRPPSPAPRTGTKRPLSSSITAPEVPVASSSSTTHYDLPRLPDLDGNLLLQVYTHKSLRRTRGTDEETNRDNERLAVLGKAVLDLAITSALFDQTPRPDAEEIEVEQEQLTREYGWAQLYGLLQDLRCHPNIESSLRAEETAQTMFRAYVGAVFVHSGYDVAQDWIHQLFALSNDGQLRDDGQPHKKLKSDSGKLASEPEDQIFFGFQPKPPEATAQIAPRPVDNPMSPAQPSIPFLASFHQAAVRRGVSVTYSADMSGPSHACQWTVKCLVNGILKGEGKGGHKQAAKEDAARVAYYAMGWT